MKTTNRIPKAIAVVLIMGLGLLNNIDEEVMKHSWQDATAEWNNSENATAITSDKKIFIYSKSLIKTSIQHIISTI